MKSHVNRPYVVSRRRARLGSKPGAFTLIELLLVLVILSILAGIVVGKFAGKTEQARIAAAKTDISTIETAVDAFEVETGRYPTSQEGLSALMTQPPGLTSWKGPYMKKAVGNDPWGNAYVYKCPGQHNTSGYDLYSTGPDGQDGSADDITNWDAGK